MKKIKILLIFLLSCLCYFAQAQVEFNVRQLSNCNEFQVSLTPTTTYFTPFNLTNSAQVTLVVPTGSVNISNLSSITGNWSFTAPMVIAPSENPAFDYINFQLTNNTSLINYQAGVEVPLFSITTIRNCAAGNVVLMNNNTDPFRFPNSQNINVGNSITVLGAGGNAYSGNYNNGTNTTPPTTASSDCLIEYQIAQVGDNLFQVSLTPDTTWTGVNAITSTAQVSIRVPSGSLNIGNLTNSIPTAVWKLNSSYFNPPENPGWDYYSFGLELTQDIPYNKGVPVNLFRFENLGNCTGSSIVLIDNGTDPLMQSNSQSANIEQQITVSGWQMEDVPVCVAGDIITSCTPSNQSFPSNCLIEYQIEQVGDKIFQVSLTPDTTWTGVNAITSTAQVSIRVPSGSLIAGNLTNNIPTAIWKLNSSYFNPPENPGWDYYSFGLELTQDIPYTKGVKVNLFRFENLGNCTGSNIILIDNTTDPLMQPNSQSANIEQQITISGWQMEDVPVCVSGDITTTCSSSNQPFPVNCLIEYQLESIGSNLFQVSLTPNITWTGINAYTATGQVSIRVPSGSFVMGNLVNNIPTARWTRNSRYLSPPENPAWDYYSFGLEYTPDIPYTQGVKVNLFQFENLGSCTGDSIYLIDNTTDPLMQPNTQNANIEQQLTVSGWQMEDVPICIADGTSAACCSCFSGNNLDPDFTMTLGCADEQSSFQTTVFSNITNWFWNFGDGIGVSSLPNPSYTYSNSGTYTVSLIVTYSDGEQKLVVKQVNICDDAATPPSNTLSASRVCMGEATQFTCPAGTNINSVLWNFGDGVGTSTQKNPSYIYQAHGTYKVSLTIYYTNGTSTTLVEDAIVDPMIWPLVRTMKDTVCVGECVRLQAQGGDSYAWSPSTTIDDPTFFSPVVCPTSTTTYTVIIGNNIGCTATGNVTVYVADPPVIQTINDINVCAGEPATLGVASGEGDFQWGPVGTIVNGTIENAIANPTSTTEYCVTLTDSHGCTASDCMTVTVLPNPIVSAGNDQEICSGNTAQLNATGGINYQWSPAINITNAAIPNPIVSPNTTTTYCVTVTDNNGCTATDCVIITVNDISTSLNNDATICAGQSTLLSATGGASYNWSPSIGLSSTTISNPTASPVTSTNYCVTITNAAGCTEERCVLVNVNSSVTANAGQDVSICKDQPTQLFATGGSTYRWSPTNNLSNASIGNPIASPAITTNYCVTVTDSNGCTDTDCVQVLVENNLVANAGQDQTICRGENVVLNASGGTTYRWSPSNGLSNSTVPNPVVTPNATTTYCVTITDNNGCVASDCVNIIVDGAIAANAGNDITLCRGNTSQLSASGGTNYRWSPSIGLSNTNSSNPIVTANTTTTYCVTVTDNAGCEASDCVNVIVENGITANAGNDVTICSSGMTQLVASGGVSYEWSPTIGLNNPNINNPIASPNASTSYCVTVTSAKGCTSVDCVQVNIGSSLTANAGTDQSICTGASTQLTASGGTSYQWSPTNGLSNPNSQNPVATPSLSTTYCVTVSDGNNCTGSDCVTINVGNSLTASAGPDQSICLGNSTQLAASGGNSYQWNPSLGLSNASIANPISSPTTTTIYCVTVTDNNGCTDTDCMRVQVGNSINPNAGNDISICSGTTAVLNASGGSTYRWLPSTGLSNPNIANPTVNVNSSTVYCVTVTDINGCTGTDCVNVNIGNSITANAGNDISICNGSTAQLNASGGTSYQWSPTSGLSNATIANPTVNVSTPRTYCVTVTDANGCTGTDCVNVSIGETVVANAGSDQRVCSGSLATLNASGGTSYRWFPTSGLSNPNVANPTVNITVPTTYCVTVMENGKCSSVDCITIDVSNGLSANAGNDINICSGSSASLNASGGSTYRWSPTSGLSNPNIANPTVTATSSTVYCVTVTDNNGCTGTDCVNVNVGNTINVSAGTDKTICRGTSTQLSASGGTSYSWTPTTGLSNPNIANPTVSPSVTTIYCVTASTTGGCSKVDCVQINVNEVVTANAGNDISTCNGGATNLNATGGTGYSWSPTSGLSNPNIANPIVNVSVPTTYCVTVTDNGKCAGVDCVTVNINGGITANAGNDVSICKGEATKLYASGGTSYSWTPSAGLSDPNSATPTVSPTVTTIYCVNVSNGNCSKVDCVTVNVSDVVNANAGNDRSVCNGSSTTLNASGGTSYSWSPTAGLNNPTIANPTVNVSVPTTYCVTVTENGKCAGVDCVTVNVNGSITANAGNDISICNGTSATLNASGGTTYRWSPSAGLSNPNIANPTVNISSPTTYCVTVTDNNGCSGIDCVNVSIGSGTTANAGTDIAVCIGNSAQLNASGGVSYQWSPTVGLNNPNIAAPTVTPTASNTYCVTVTDINGCTAQDCMTVSTKKIQSSISNDITICEGDKTPLIATGGDFYSWTPTTGLSNPNIASPIASPTSTITYCANISAEDCTKKECVTITVIDCTNGDDDNGVPGICNPGANAVACPDKNICIGEETQLVVNGGDAWSWSPSNSLNNPFTAYPLASPIVTTTYTVTVTDLNGCTDTDQVTIYVDNCGVTPGPCSNGPLVVACEDKTICAGENVQLTVTTGLTYQWLPVTNLSNPFSGVPIANPSTTTTYSVTVTDINGCTGTDEVTIYVTSDCSNESNPQPCTTPAFVVACEDKFICKGGSIRLNVTTGASYEWSPDNSLSHPNVGAPIARPLSTTVYTVTLTDENGCTGTDEVTVFVNEAQAFAGVDVSTCGSAVQLNASGGNTYRWSPSAGLSNTNIANPVANPSATTVYCVSITDLDGCTATDCVEVTVGSSFPAVACEDKSICQGANVTLTVTSGSAYSWSPSTGLSNTTIGTPIASPSQTTTYFVTVTDEFGCTSVDDVIVNVDPNCTNGRSCPEGILPTIPMTIELSDCQLSGELCLPIERSVMSDYIFKINGIEQTEEAFKDCQLNYSFAYTYFTVPDRGKNGPYHLDQWIVDGNDHSGTFETIEELIQLMNSIDPSGNWIADESTLTIKGGHPEVKYSTMSIEQIASNATAMLDLNTNITPSETILILPIGTNEVEIMLKETGCKAQASISVTCPNDFVCADLFLEENIERTLNDCEELIEVCLEFPLLSAAEYTYLHNGLPYQGDGGFCSLSGTTTALYVGAGEHELIVTHINTGCTDTLYVVATCSTPLTNEAEPEADTDEVTTNVNEAITIDVSANDRSLGVVQSIEIITYPTKGQVAIMEDQSINYQPNEDYCDTELGDKFSYKICNDYGCDVADVLVKVACKPLSVYSGFSPNGDGINDYFKIEGVEEYPNSTLQVFNRWGTLIFQQKAYQNDWDGQYKSNPLADGVYFYLFMDGYGNKQSGYIQISR